MIKNKSFVIRNDSQNSSTISNALSPQTLNEVVDELNTKINGIADMVNTLFAKLEKLETLFVKQDDFKSLFEDQMNQQINDKN